MIIPNLWILKDDYQCKDIVGEVLNGEKCLQNSAKEGPKFNIISDKIKKDYLIKEIMN